MKLFVAPFLLLFLVFSCKPAASDKDKEAIMAEGTIIAKSTGKKLAGTLMEKIKSGGIPEAIEFCNTAAIPLTDKVADSFKVSIKRTSLKTRNPLNKPDDAELAVLKKYEVELMKGLPLQPVVETETDASHFYAPIIIESKCLMCHGTVNKELSRPIDSIIKTKYPEDMATGYQEGDLRGMWSITFSK